MRKRCVVKKLERILLKDNPTKCYEEKENGEKTCLIGCELILFLDEKTETSD